MLRMKLLALTFHVVIAIASGRAINVVIIATQPAIVSEFVRALSSFVESNMLEIFILGGLLPSVPYKKVALKECFHTHFPIERQPFELY